MKICSVEGCERQANRVTYGWCEKHYMRWRRHGDPTFLMADLGHSHNGYHMVRGRYEHRIVLCDKIGPGGHPCHWCGQRVVWGIDLEVDHLDADRQNNDPSNLVPSCHACNTRRAQKPCPDGCTCGRHGRATAERLNAAG